jgi:hypothetical protein
VMQVEESKVQGDFQGHAIDFDEDLDLTWDYCENGEFDRMCGSCEWILNHDGQLTVVLRNDDFFYLESSRPLDYIIAK